MAPRIKIDGRFTYFEAAFLKHMRRFDLLLQIVITHWWLPVEVDRHVAHV